LNRVNIKMQMCSN